MARIPPEKLKTLLIDQGFVTAEQFDELAEEAVRMNQKIEDLLIARRYATYDYLYNFLASYYGVARANLSAQMIDRTVLLSIEEKFAQERKIIAFSKDADGTINLAMDDPTDLQTVEFLQRKFQSRIRPFLATPEDLAAGFSLYSNQLNEDFKKIIEEKIKQSLQQQQQGKVEKEEEAGKQIQIVDLVNNLLSYAAYLNTSDIHIEAMEDEVLVRFRIDGILHEVMMIPRQVLPAIIARIKLLAALKVDEHQKPQDGRFRHQLGQGVVDIRVSIIPTLYGEKIVMRLLAASQRPLSLTELGFSDDMARTIQENIKKTFGMILVTGPTGSGKTTTLYSVLNMLNRPEINIVTIEDPIEYNIKYINQIQINPLAGITFASGLRSILRQDPNVIMVGEVRDEETAEIAVQAALTGHIVLSSLHTNDATSTIPRLVDMHVPPFLLAAVVNVCVAQRLVRRICQECIMSYTPTEEFLTSLSKQMEELGIPQAELPHTLYKGKGCPVCNNIGYKGRMGIYEIFEVNDEARKVITKPDFTLQDLIDVARKYHMTTMFEDGLRKVTLGQTTVEEVLRVIRE